MLAKAHDAAEVARADDLLAEARELHAAAMRLRADAERRGDVRLALTAIDKLTRLLEVRGKLAGQIATGINVAVSVGQAGQPEPSRDELLAELVQAADLLGFELVPRPEIIATEGSAVP